MSHSTNNREPLQRLEVSFLTSAPNLAQCPAPDGPEIAFAGRSNAGKSSVLNQLTGNRRTAKVSKTPGRTQLLNFFEVRGGGRVVDLPGYGYAKAARATQTAWQQSVNEYLSFRDSLCAVVLVSDIRHPGQPFDMDLIQWSVESEIPLLMLLNKADKLKQGARSKALRDAERQFASHPTVQVQCFSAQSGLGHEQAYATIMSWLT
jgi:GTP-binding protein